MTCRICGREAEEGGYCPFHERAYENIQWSFACWKKGLNIPWTEYLKEIN